MAYRRLPNTDNSRLMAILRLNELLMLNESNLLNENSESILEHKITFEGLVEKRKNFVLERSLLNKVKKTQMEELRIYVSHFLQVFNFAIDRNDISKKSRYLFGLEKNTGTIPLLSKETEVLKWAENIIEGECRRIDGGDVGISHPNYLKIEEVKNITDSLIMDLQVLEKSFESYQSDILKQRQKTDAFIKEIWNQIELQFINEPIEVKRKKAARFGVVYVI